MAKLRKKILVLTMRLGSNYGGAIQAYALQDYLSKKGFDTHTSTLTRPNIYRKEFTDSVKRYILKKVLKKDLGFIPTEKDLRIITHSTSRFISNNIKTINLLSKQVSMQDPLKGYGSIIVGSDQVWRASYVNVSDYLLGFIDNKNIKKISYAASFGKDDLSEYSPELIEETAKLAKKFDAISVREDSGIDICKKYWGVSAEQVIDPTLLIEKEQYIKLIESDETVKSNGDLFTYILDRSSDKQIIIEKVAENLKLKPFEIMPLTCNSRKEFRKNPEKFILPPVTQWLRCFMDAEFVVTDSFHGCVFSIIFNKSFIAIGNKSRGLTRFTSLLKLFDLENRLISSFDNLTDDLFSERINWRYINNIIKSEQQRSRKFLLDNLVKGTAKDD